MSHSPVELAAYDWLRIGAVEIYPDGSLVGRTAAVHRRAPGPAMPAITAVAGGCGRARARARPAAS